MATTRIMPLHAGKGRMVGGEAGQIIKWPWQRNSMK